jgi:hypothetical protein
MSLIKNDGCVLYRAAIWISVGWKGLRPNRRPTSEAVRSNVPVATLPFRSQSFRELDTSTHTLRDLMRHPV